MAYGRCTPMRDKPLGSLGAVPGQGALSSNNRLNKQDLIKILAACLGLSWSRRDKISSTKTKRALGEPCLGVLSHSADVATLCFRGVESRGFSARSCYTQRHKK